MVGRSRPCRTLLRFRPGIPFIPLALQVGNFASQKLGSRKCVLRKVLMGPEEPILPRGDLGDLLCV